MIRFSERVTRLESSPIREILAVIERPGMISFAGGLPAQDSFVMPDFSAMSPRFLQYGASEGEQELRSQIARDMAAQGLDCQPEQVLVLSGSQQGIDLVAKLMVDPGTLLALENPTYLAALQVFRFFGARFMTLDPADPGMMARSPERPRLCYTVPTFQNPGGYCYTREERQTLARVCEHNDILLFEDDPYRDLVYGPCDRTPVCSFMRSGNWVYQGSFSKSHAPGLRLGFLVCSPDLCVPLTRLKQATDLHSSRLAQYWILQQLRSAHREERLQQLQSSYRDKRDTFAAILDANMTGHASWLLPAGGLFFWLQLKQQIDTQALLQQALGKGVAFMPGEAFFHTVTAEQPSCIRLNFSHASEAQMHKGIALLAGLLARA